MNPSSNNAKPKAQAKQREKTYYNNHMDAVKEENKALKARVEKLERENHDLKGSVFNLSYLYNTCYYQLKTLGSSTSVVSEGVDFKGKFDLQSVLSSADVAKAAAADKTKNSLKELKIDLKTEETSIDGQEPKKDNRLFYKKFELLGHEGSVYIVRFSACGKFLASGSFDKSVRLWDLGNKGQEVCCMEEHQLNVSTLAWSQDSTKLISGAYDRTVKCWDVNTGQSIYSSDTVGFVQAVMLEPEDNNVFYVGCTHKQILGYDFRTGKKCRTFQNDAMVNTLHVYKQGDLVVSGDNLGYLKFWNTKMERCIRSVLNDKGHKPISHVHGVEWSKQDGMSDTDMLNQNLFLGVNSFDNVIRVYDLLKGSFVPQQKNKPNPVNNDPLYLVGKCEEGHKNKNWPIKSSFYRGENFHGVQEKSSEIKREGNSREENLKDTSSPNTNTQTNTEDSLLLATGSADNNVYVYDIGHGDGKLVQKLKGHRDIVYCATFHPSEPFLATASADSTVRFWAPKSL